MNGTWGSEFNDPQNTLVPCTILRGTDFSNASLGSLTNAPLRFIDGRDVQRKMLKSGDIVVEISGGSETQATGRTLLITHELISNANAPLLCTNFAKALRINTGKVAPKFFSVYWLCLYELGRPFVYEKRTTGIRNFQYKDFVANESILLPPLAAQRAIAAYLDRETTRIDTLIAKTQQLNALLREQRVALISHAVTKGLDPTAPLKNSGVEWLKEIPNHWDVKRIRHVVQTSPLKSELRYTSDELEVSFLPMKAIGADGKLDLTHVTQIADVYEGYTYFCEHDVLIAKITPSFENGKGAIARKLVNGIGFGTTELFVLPPRSGLPILTIYTISRSHHDSEI